MKSQASLIDDLFKITKTNPHDLKDPEVAHLLIHSNQVLGMQAVPGLEVDVKELDEGVDIKIALAEGTKVKKPVHLCFGMFPETGIQRVLLDVNIGANAIIPLQAHCVFPFAVDVQHIMDAKIKIGDGAQYSYFERHIHSPSGGVKVYPKAVIEVGKKARFNTEFELLKGRVGLLEIDFESICDSEGVVDMTARVSGQEDDIIRIKETCELKGDHSRGLITSKIAVRDEAKAEVFNKLIATGAYARGHVDCKEIVQDNGVASAIPIVEVHHPKAHITHEAAIGSVDSRQLETLMSRGLSEDTAVELIINGLLSQ
jgi:Fe-S cluster assembly scaffold protein SufB